MPDETLLAFDFGLKRIGVAIGEKRLGTARALTTINSEINETRFHAIEQLLKEWQPARLIVGRPLHEDGSPHELSSRCERFGNQLRGRYRLPVEYVDERFSSLEAENTLRQTHVAWQERKTKIDAEAAKVILQSWFQQSSS